MWAPSSPARFSKRSSKTLRLTANSHSLPDGRSTITLRPPTAINSTKSSFAWGRARTCCARSSRSSTGQHAGFRQSPQTFSRGNFSRSRTIVCNPARAQNAAQLDPAGPPPTIATSNVSISFSLEEMQPAQSHFGARKSCLSCWVYVAGADGAQFRNDCESKLMGWSLPILRVAGIQLRIHVTFLLLIAWLAFGYYAEGGSAAAAARVLFILLLFACVVLHEFGHALAAKAFGINTPDITLLPIGGVARLERMPEKPVQELVIALAGPMVNVVIALGLFVAGGSQAFLNPSNVEGGGLIAQLLTINILLLLFNFLPAFPMDGGRVLRALLATRLSYARATQVAASIGQGFAFVFGFIGLIWNPFLIFIALFVYIGASQEAALAQMKDVSRRFPVSSAMVREFHTLPENATLQEAVDALLATSQHDFPVVDEAGNVAGVLTRHDLIAALRKDDPQLRVSDVMRRDIPTVTTGTRFEEAFRIMQECNCPAVPVLDSMKRLVGLLTPENVTELMMVHSALPQRRPA